MCLSYSGYYNGLLTRATKVRVLQDTPNGVAIMATSLFCKETEAGSIPVSSTTEGN